MLSSHLMGEIEQVSDRVGVIRDGSAPREPSRSCAFRAGLQVRAEPLSEAAPGWRSPGRRRVTSVDGLLEVTVDTAQAPAITRVLVEAGVAVSSSTPRKPRSRTSSSGSPRRDDQ